MYVDNMGDSGNRGRRGGALPTPNKRSTPGRPAATPNSKGVSDAPTVPVFIENTRELFSYPLEKGALTRVSDLASTVSKKLKVPLSTLTFKVHRARVGTGDRLCTFPDGTVIQCHVDSDTFAQINLSSPSNAADFSTGTGGPVSARSIVSDDAPTVVSDTRSIRKLDMSREFAGTQANVTLSETPNSAATTGRGSVALPQPQIKVKLLTLSVALDGCDEVGVTVDVTSNVSDLRVRCSVSADDFPTVSCNGRRVLFEQRSFEEQLIGEQSKIVFHRKRDEDWEDGSRLGMGAEAVASVSRLMRTSGGKAIPLGSELQPRINASASPAFAGAASPPRAQYQQQQYSRQHSRMASDMSYSSSVGGGYSGGGGGVPGASPITPLTPGRLADVSRVDDLPPSPSNFNKAVSPSRMSSARGSARGGGAPDISGVSANSGGTAPYAASRSSPPRFNNYGGPAVAAAAGGGGQRVAGLNSTSLNMSGSHNDTISSQQQQQQQQRGGAGGDGGPVTVHVSPRARNPNALLKEHSRARQRAQLAAGRQSQMQSTLLQMPLAAAGDNPSKTAWITPAQRPAEYDTPEYEAARNGCSLNIRFEDPTDDGYVHDLRVWSLNPVAHLFPFAGDESEQYFYLLCDGELVLYPHHAFATVTKGRQYCHFSFARKS